VERAWYSRPYRRGRDRLYDGAVAIRIVRRSADERSDERTSHGADPGLPRATLDRFCTWPRLLSFAVRLKHFKAVAELPMPTRNPTYDRAAL